MRPKNPYEKEHCNWCGKSLSNCYDNLCGDLQDCIKEDAWDEGYNACAQQRISEQEGWQTGEPSKDEGPFLLELADCFIYESKYRTADWFEPAKIDREAVFITNDRAVFPYIFLKYVKRWKLI
jgi:hypothetical protein